MSFLLFLRIAVDLKTIIFYLDFLGFFSKVRACGQNVYFRLTFGGYAVVAVDQKEGSWLAQIQSVHVEIFRNIFQDIQDLPPGK